VPDHAGIRRLTLSDLSDETLVDLVRHGEDLLVERKQALPDPPKFGAAVASFANLLGGWLLLGVADDKTVVGWDKPQRIDLQSHLAAVLRAEVEPLPPFVCEMREVDSKPIAVLRIFPSTDSPHIVRGTGAVYVRSSKGKEPVDDHQTLLSLARRGEDAQREALDRLELLLVRQVLRTPDVESPATARSIRYIVRAAPLTVTPALTAWPLTRGAAEACVEIADRLVPPLASVGPPRRRRGPEIRPRGRAVVVTISQRTEMSEEDSASVVADSGGVFGIERRRGVASERRPAVLLNALLDEEIRPLVTEIATLLATAEAIGRVVLDMWIAMPPRTTILPVEANPPLALHVSGELVIPAQPDEIESLAQAWHREIQREIGIVKYEGE
jgi:hypothetical protein